MRLVIHEGRALKAIGRFPNTPGVLLRQLPAQQVHRNPPPVLSPLAAFIH